jgi:NAD(P)H-hydrate repair Nnr-like enzyme with NAD(P)H-hydrate epimerase domain
MNTVDSLSPDEQEKALNRRLPGHVVYDAIIGTGASRRMKNQHASSAYVVVCGRLRQATAQVYLIRTKDDQRTSAW